MMNKKRVILEMGSGNDLHGRNYTKAALRAVNDALHHSSLTMIRTLGIETKNGMFVDVIIGVKQPSRVNKTEIENALPYGSVTVKVVNGGLDVPDEVLGDVAVIASAAVIVSLNI